MGRGKDSSGVVLCVKLARLGRDEFSSFVLCTQLPRIVGMGHVKMSVDLFSMSCGLGFTGWSWVKSPADSFSLFSRSGFVLLV